MALSFASTRKATLLVVVLFLSVAPPLAQSPVQLPKNKYTPQQDVELGRKGATEVRAQYPVIDDQRIAEYLARLGDRLVTAAPPELKNPVFEYSFTAVNLSDINAFALPGGPMFVHRGMFDAAEAEGEVVGVMAHELAHVLLRHGTANATKAQNPWLLIGQLAGAIGGAVVGGQAGSAIVQGSQLGLGTLLLRYSREFEKQADLLGAQIMARAGYDPRSLARMFETIERETHGSAAKNPQWLSSHPNPGDRSQYITAEASMLTIAGEADDSGFAAIKTAFASLPRAVSLLELAAGRKGDSGGGRASFSVGTPGQPVPPPSTTFQSVAGGKVFDVEVPDNWTTLSSKTVIRVVPQNGHGQLNGQTVFTHGVEFGLAKASSSDLREATDTFLEAVAQRNPELRPDGTPRETRISQQAAIATPLVNPSPLGGRERIVLHTTLFSDGVLFYFLTVAPEKDAGTFQETFRRVGESIQRNGGR